MSYRSIPFCSSIIYFPWPSFFFFPLPPLLFTLAPSFFFPFALRFGFRVFFFGRVSNVRHAFRYTRFFFPLPYTTPQPHVSPTITLRRIHLLPQSKRYKSHTKCSRAIKLPLALFVFPIQSSGTVFFAFCLVGLFPSIFLFIFLSF